MQRNALCGKGIAMSLGKNIQYLRKQKKITQERLAEIMSVSRQTVSRWEADEVVPELNKLVALGELFACKPDALVRETLDADDAVYSTVSGRGSPGCWHSSRTRC